MPHIKPFPCIEQVATVAPAPLAHLITDYPKEGELGDLYAAIGTMGWECSFVECSELEWQFWLRGLGSDKVKAWNLGRIMKRCTVLDFKCNRSQEFLSAGEPVHTANKLWIIWESKLSSETGFDINPTFFVFCWHRPYWNVQLETASLPFETVRAALGNDETCFSKCFKASQVFYRGNVVSVTYIDTLLLDTVI